jgi:hypothetical protein
MQTRRTLLSLLVVIVMTGSAYVAGAAQLEDDIARRAAVKCQRTVAAANGALLNIELGKLRVCTQAILKCVQTKASDERCREKARAKCTKLLELDIPAVQDKAARKVEAKCENAKNGLGLSLTGLLASDGLKLSGLAALCGADYHVDVCDGPKAIGDCLALVHARSAQRLAGRAQPRSEELIRLFKIGGGFDALPIYPGCGDCVNGIRIAPTVR